MTYDDFIIDSTITKEMRDKAKKDYGYREEIVPGVYKMVWFAKDGRPAFFYDCDGEGGFKYGVSISLSPKASKGLLELGKKIKKINKDWSWQDYILSEIDKNPILESSQTASIYNWEPVELYIWTTDEKESEIVWSECAKAINKLAGGEKKNGEQSLKKTDFKLEDGELYMFEFQDGKSAKFWSIELNGESFTVNYGKMGTNGQEQTKEYDDKEECFKQAKKLVTEKIKKGYVFVGGEHDEHDECDDGFSYVDKLNDDLKNALDDRNIEAYTEAFQEVIATGIKSDIERAMRAAIEYELIEDQDPDLLATMAVSTMVIGLNTFKAVVKNFEIAENIDDDFISDFWDSIQRVYQDYLYSGNNWHLSEKLVKTYYDNICEIIKIMGIEVKKMAIMTAIFAFYNDIIEGISYESYLDDEDYRDSDWPYTDTDLSFWQKFDPDKVTGLKTGLGPWVPDPDVFGDGDCDDDCDE